MVFRHFHNASKNSCGDDHSVFNTISTGWPHALSSSLDQLLVTTMIFLVCQSCKMMFHSLSYANKTQKSVSISNAGDMMCASPKILSEPEIMVGHQTFSSHFKKMSNQLSLCSDIMSDHLITPDQRYSTLKITKSCAGLTCEHKL